MPIVTVSQLPSIERLPGWTGRYFHTSHMTFAHYDFTRGATIHEHFHPQEEVYEVVAGELEVIVEGVPNRLTPGVVGIVPSGARHAVTAISDGCVIVVDYPARPEFG